ncbi:MAG: circadian clock protein KaiC [Terriglobia bacterium]
MSKKENPQLPKTATGIPGLDEILGGGLPRGRPTLVCGGAGSGKTLLAMECLVRGATEFNEPGVFMTFEENATELAQNFSALGFDLNGLVRRKKISLDYVHVERSEIAETGEYDLEGLFIRLGQAIDSIGAQRVVLDTIESLFSGLPNQAILRAELRRLFGWLKAKSVTTIITSERGEGALTRQGLEEYVSDCVILLDHRVTEQISTRRLRVVKYRGSTHGTNEFPFLVAETGLSVLPITSLVLKHSASTERISTGIPALDGMLGDSGFYRGSTVLVSGVAGSGKTSLAAHFADAACRRDEPVLYQALEESPSQIMRNMRSIGIDLEPWTRTGLLQFHAIRPTFYGLEMHLVAMHSAVEAMKPRVVIVDPVTSFGVESNHAGVKAMLVRLVDFLKVNQITALFSHLTPSGSGHDQAEVGISSLIDTWLVLQNAPLRGEPSRTLQILKSRGMAHSCQVREFMLTNHGVRLCDVNSAPREMSDEVQHPATRSDRVLKKGVAGLGLALTHQK